MTSPNFTPPPNYTGGDHGPHTHGGQVLPPQPALPAEPSVAPEGQSAEETEAKAEWVQGTLGDHVLLVPPTKKWKVSALEALSAGRYSEWAEKTLSDEDFELWEEADCTVEEMEAFFKDINGRLGTDPGKSRSSRRSSTRTFRH